MIPEVTVGLDTILAHHCGALLALKTGYLPEVVAGLDRISLQQKDVSGEIGLIGKN